MTTLFTKLGMAGLAAAAVVFSSQNSSAVTISYSFDNVTANSTANIGTAGQYIVDVSDQGVAANQVKFTFRNTGPAASSITDIYFDDADPALLLGFASIANGAGVSFSQGASPQNLPGGNTISFSADFGADSNAPTQPRGVNPGETLDIIFNLLSPNDFADVTAALNAGGTSGLRIGIHVQGFANGGSESFVSIPPNTPPTDLPDGGSTAILMGLGALGLGFMRKLRW